MPQKVCGGDILYVMAFVKNFEMPPKIDSKWGISKNSSLKKWGISKIKHVISFRTEKREKLKLFDFGAFQKFMQMPSREKYLLHILFGAFQVPSRSRNSKTCLKDVSTLFIHVIIQIKTWVNFKIFIFVEK